MATTKNYELMAATSIAGDIQSSPLLAGRLDGFSVQCVTTGDAAGTVKLQASNDAGVIPEEGEHAATGLVNWTDVTDGTLPVAGAGVYTFDFVAQYYRWARVVYVSASGTGTMVIRVSGKVSR